MGEIQSHNGISTRYISLMNIFVPNSEIKQINILTVFFENLVKINPEIGPGETNAEGQAIGYFHRDQPLW